MYPTGMPKILGPGVSAKVLRLMGTFFGGNPRESASWWMALNAALARPKFPGFARVFAEEANNKLIFPLFFSKMLICRSDQSGPLYQPILETSSPSYTDLPGHVFCTTAKRFSFKVLTLKYVGQKFGTGFNYTHKFDGCGLHGI